MKTQCKMLLEYLQAGNSINPLESWNILGIYRLAARINDLKKEGYSIISKRIAVFNRFNHACRVASYSMEVI